MSDNGEENGVDFEEAMWRLDVMCFHVVACFLCIYIMCCMWLHGVNTWMYTFYWIR